MINEARALGELAGSVAWSVIVCTGVAIGVSVGKARAALAGAIGMLFAPLALAGAKAAQKVMASLVEATVQPAVFSLATLSVVRALEYGLLAWMLTLLTERKAVRLMPYLLAGAGVGIASAAGFRACRCCWRRRTRRSRRSRCWSRKSARRSGVRW